MKGIIIGGIVIALGATAYFLSKKKTGYVAPGRYHKLTPVTKNDTINHTKSEKHLPVNSPAYVFFNNAVENYRKKLLAYSVLNAAEEAGISAEQRLNLTEEYGMVSLAPMLSAELSGVKEAGICHADLERAAANWLLQHPGGQDGIDDIDSIEDLLKEEMQQEANKIINNLNNQR